MPRQFSFIEDSDSEDDEEAAAPAPAPPPGSAGSSSSHAAQATTAGADAATAPAAPAADAADATADAAADAAADAEEVEQAVDPAFSSVPQRFQRLNGEAVPLTFRLLFDDAQFHAMCASGAADHPGPVQPVLCGEPVRCRGPFDASGSRSTELFTGVQLGTAHEAVAFVPSSAAASGDAGPKRQRYCTVPVPPEWTLSCWLRTPLAPPHGNSAVISLASAAGPDPECHLQVRLFVAGAPLAPAPGRPCPLPPGPGSISPRPAPLPTHPARPRVQVRVSSDGAAASVGVFVPPPECPHARGWHPLSGVDLHRLPAGTTLPPAPCLPAGATLPRTHACMAS